MGERPIAHKYREGKVKSTLERELRVLKSLRRKLYSVSSRLETRTKESTSCASDWVENPNA